METKINGKTVKLVTVSDIETKFSEDVERFLSHGFKFHLASMHGCQGELASVDLIQSSGSTTVWRLILESKYNINSHGNYNTLVFRILMFHDKKGCETLWNGEGVVDTEIVYYMVSNQRVIDLCRQNDAYTTDEEAFLQLIEMRHERWQKNERQTERTIRPTQKTLELVRKHHGYKTVKLDDIKDITVDKRTYRNGIESAYLIHFNNGKKTITVSSN